jgi:hypothetical protein
MPTKAHSQSIAHGDIYLVQMLRDTVFFKKGFGTLEGWKKPDLACKAKRTPFSFYTTYSLVFHADELY